MGVRAGYPLRVLVPAGSSLLSLTRLAQLDDYVYI
nr:MAG TPA: hypothetical protein [Microviridae sp.]